jgi:sirohydrochlorin ferrochelatase
MLSCMAHLVQYMAGDGVIVRFAHMELAEPSIDAGVAACVEAGATEIIAFPYMLSPGRHATSDIPHLVAGAAARYPAVTVRVTPAFGVHERLGELILSRAGLAATRLPTDAEAACCWNPAGTRQACGDACRALDPVRAATVGSPLGATA